jgi:hypothetical protein
MAREQKRKRRIIRMDWSGIIVHAHKRVFTRFIEGDARERGLVMTRLRPPMVFCLKKLHNRPFETDGKRNRGDLVLFF